MKRRATVLDRPDGSSSVTVEQAAAHPQRPVHGRSNRVLMAVGTALVLVGVVVLGYLAWQLWGTNVVAHRAQRAEIAQLHDEWTAPTPVGSSPRPGRPFAIVRIPRFGAGYAVPLVDGVSEDDLARGIGWFPQTAPPGAIGNFVIAAHRITHGEPFRNFPSLRRGDEVVVETRTAIYTYVLDQDGGSRTVDFGQTWILDPVPGHPAAAPHSALITLVTCAELFHTDNRNVVVGHLRSVQDKAPARSTRDVHQ